MEKQKGNLFLLLLYFDYLIDLLMMEVDDDNLNFVYSEKEQIQKIFKMLGTPNIKELPIYEKFPGWKEEEWEIYPRKDFKELCPRLSSDGVDLLCKLLEYDPEKRISAADALEHPFFKDIDKKTLSLYNK